MRSVGRAPRNFAILESFNSLRPIAWVQTRQYIASIYGAKLQAKGGPESFLAEGPGQPHLGRGLGSFSALNIINALHVAADLVR
jgi:hypothetical protein